MITYPAPLADLNEWVMANHQKSQQYIGQSAVVVDGIVPSKRLSDMTLERCLVSVHVEWCNV